MSQQLTMFMEKLQREVTEGQAAARRVRLMCEGTVFETWEPVQGVGIVAEEWAAQAEALVSQLQTELPKRRCQMSFIAEDSTGAVLSTVLRTVTGQNANAQDLGTQNGAKALADAIAGVAKTTDFVLEMCRKVLTDLSAQNEKQAEQLAEAHELFMNLKKAELEATEQGSAATGIMLEQLQNAGPLVLQLLENWAKSGPKSPGGAAASVANTVTNGAKAS